MTQRITDYLDVLFEKVDFNEKRLNLIIAACNEFVHKNEEHLMFFGGNLLGVHRVRFTPTDSNSYFENIASVDIDSIKEAIASDKNFNTDFLVTSDPFNVTSFYIAHRFLTSTKLSDAKRYKGATMTLLYFQYKIISSLLAYYFKYPADPEIALATYTILSGRYLIKRLGTWQKVFEYRSKEILKDDSVHSHTLVKFDDDFKIMYMLADSQGRIRDMVKNIYAEFIKVHVSGERIDTTSMHSIEIDGKETIADKVKGPTLYTDYILSIIADKHSFIKEELLALILQCIPALSIKILREALDWLVEEIHSKDRKEIEHFIRQVMVYSIEYLNRNSKVLDHSKDVAAILLDMRNLYLSSRSSDKYLQEIRTVGEIIVSRKFKKIGYSQKASLRTGIILYIILRAFTHHYFS